MKRLLKTEILTLLLICLLVPLAAQSPIDFYNTGYRSMASGDYFTALDNYKKALEINPSYTDALLGISRTYFLLQEYEEALDYSRLALKGSERRIDAINLQGRIYLGLSDLEKASEMFNLVQSIEPNNMTAAYGLAEIAVFRGNYKEGSSLFEKSLAVNPDSRRALLSLVVLADKMGDAGKAEQYLESALAYYPQDRVVLNEAIRHYVDGRRWDQAEALARQLVALEPENRDTNLTLGHIYTNTGDFDQAVHYFQESIKNEQENPMLWFYLGRAFLGLGRHEEALLCFQTVNLLNPQDEVARLTAENLLMSYYPLNHDQRVAAAAWHFEKGRSYKASFQYDKAFDEYRRGRLLAPLDLDGWWQYAGILNAMGQGNRYREELEALHREEYANLEFNRLYELVMSSEDLSFPRVWETPVIQRNSNINLALFIDKSASDLYHTGSEMDFIRYLGDTLMRNSGLSIDEQKVLESSSDAFSAGRNGNSDFYALLSVSEKERSIRINCRLFLSRTGNEITSFDLLRSGNMRVSEIIRKAAEELEQRLPVKGYLAGIDGDRVLVNLGTMNNVEAEMSFVLLRQGTGRWLDREPYRDYQPEDVLGTVTIEETQEKYSIGILQRNSPFDLVNAGDEIYRLPEDMEELVLPEDTMNNELKNQLLRLY